MVGGMQQSVRGEVAFESSLSLLVVLGTLVFLFQEASLCSIPKTNCGEALGGAWPRSWSDPVLEITFTLYAN